MGLVSVLWLGAALAGAPGGDPSSAASEPAWQVRSTLLPERIAPGADAVLRVEIDVPEGWHLWSLDPGPGPKALRVHIESPAVQADGGWFGTAPRAVFDRGFGRELLMYEGRVVLARKLQAPSNEGRHPADLKIDGQICSESSCITQRYQQALLLSVAADGAAEAAAIKLPPLSVASDAVAAAPASAQKLSSTAKMRSGGVWAFLVLAFGFGLGALATPCVFPAIPLTISFFSKFSDQRFGRAARLAATYALTMVLAFTLGGVLVSILLGASGVQASASSPYTNLFLGGMLVFFALNLLGLFEIQTPRWMLAVSNGLEQRFGRGRAIDQGQRGWADYVMVSVAAISATTVFFTCTVGFVGILLVEAATGAWFWPTIGMLAFSSAFALPFFLLALFPQAAMRLRGKGGTWLGLTRGVLGFLELAAATKFFSNVDLVWRWALLSREVVLSFWVVLFVAAGLFVFGKLSLGEAASDDRPGVGRLLASMVAFSFSLYLAVGLFHGRAFGNWIDGWLPPLRLPGQAVPVAGNSEAFAWKDNLEAARAEARATNRLVFVNYTGYTCTNCRFMEGSIFPHPDVRARLDRMVLVELYTDGEGPAYRRNQEDQLRRYQTAALPLYAVEDAEGRPLGHFAGSTNDPRRFVAFLDGAMKKVRAAPSDGAVLFSAHPLFGGDTHALSTEGRWTLLNFWAHWCGPCKEEISAFLVREGQRVRAAGHSFHLVAVEAPEDEAEARRFLREEEVPSEVAWAVSPDAAAQFGPRLGFTGDRLPYTVLIAPSGEVVWRHSERLSQEALRAAIEAHTDLKL